MMDKVLITGTAGFIGHHLSMLLADRGYKVVGLDQINDYYDTRLKYDRLRAQGIDVDRLQPGEIQRGRIDFIQMDLEDKAALEALFASEKFDQVIHLAAQPGVRYSITHPEAYIARNIIGFFHLLECVRTYPPMHFIFASTSSVYGLNEQVPYQVGHKADRQISLYAATKKSNEVMAHAYAHLYGIPTTGLRFFTVYGPMGRPDMAIYRFVDAIAHDRPIKVYGMGDMSRDFTYVGDIVEAISRLIPKQPEGGETPFALYNIGNNAPVPLMDFIEAIEQALGKEAKKEFLPMQAGDMKQTYADVEDLFALIDFKPATSIAEGVGRFVDWYKEYSKNE